MTEFGQRLKQARKYAKLSQDALAKRVGISQGTMSELERYYSSSSYTVQMAKECGVSAVWLATGEGEMTPSQSEKNDAIPKLEDGAAGTYRLQNVTNAVPRRTVPVVSWVAAGTFAEVEDMYEPGQADEWVEAFDSQPSNNAFALRVDGDSMTSPYPGDRSFPEGTIIIVDPNRAAHAGDFVVAKDVTSQQATFKKLVHDGGRWFLKPLNPAYPIVEIDDPAIRVIGRVIEFRIGGKL